MMIAPAGAIIAAAFIASLSPARARRIVVLAVVLVSAIDVVSRYKSGDIRGAIALAGSVADDRTVTFLGYGFQESLQPSWYDDEAAEGIADRADSYYPIPGATRGASRPT